MAPTIIIEIYERSSNFWVVQPWEATITIQGDIGY